MKIRLAQKYNFLTAMCPLKPEALTGTGTVRPETLTGTSPVKPETLTWTSPVVANAPCWPPSSLAEADCCHSQRRVDLCHPPHSVLACGQCPCARSDLGPVPGHSQLSSSSVQVWESSGKRLKSMLQAAVTVTLSNEKTTVSGHVVCIRRACTHVQVSAA